MTKTFFYVENYFRRAWSRSGTRIRTHEVHLCTERPMRSTHFWWVSSVKKYKAMKTYRETQMKPLSFYLRKVSIFAVKLWDIQNLDENCMRTRRVVTERLTANAKVATVLGSIPASSDTVESEGRQIKPMLNKVHWKKKIPKEPPV